MRGLVVDGLLKRFEGTVAVDGISFTVGPGEFVSLLGPSGCGKTTTLRCIAGFERPDQGRITMDGQALNDVDAGILVPPNKRRFGMVFQSYAVWPHMTVLQNVGYPLTVQRRHPRREIEERAREQLRVVGLAGLETRYPSQLSGGQQQRVALARALIMEPRLLLFDEPLSNLDAKLRERMRFELIDIQSKLGVPAAYVTHDQAEAMVMSRRIVVMDRGRISQEGPPQEIYAAPRSRFVAEFIGLSNFLKAEIRGRGDGGRWRVQSPLGAHECVSALTHATGDTVLLVIRPERIRLSSAPLGDGDGFAGEIRSCYFMGPHCEYLIAIGDVELRVQTDTLLDVTVGERAYAHVEASDYRVVSEEAADGVNGCSSR